MSWKKRLAAGVLLALGGLCAALLVAELGLRIFYPQKIASLEFAYDPERGAIAVPNQCGRTDWPGVYAYNRCNNSLGLRGTKEYQFNKMEPRILMLGDSFTYGTGVNDNETFSAQLQQRFDKDGKAVEVVNAGNGGTGTDYALKFFQTVGYKFHPDITAVFFFWNDYQDNSRQTFFEEKDGALVPKPLNDSLASKKSFLNNPVYRWLIAHSHLANLLKGALVNVFVQHYSTANDLVVNSNPWAFTDEAKKVTEEYILALRDETEKNGSKLVFFYLPQVNQASAYIKDGSISDEEAFLAKFLKDNNIPFVPVAPVLKASGIPVEDLYYMTEGHWKAAAHAAFADFLEPYFSGLLASTK